MNSFDSSEAQAMAAKANYVPAEVMERRTCRDKAHAARTTERMAKRVINKITRAAHRGRVRCEFKLQQIDCLVLQELEKRGFQITRHSSQYHSVKDECGRWSSSSSYTTPGYWEAKWKMGEFKP